MKKAILLFFLMAVLVSAPALAQELEVPALDDFGGGADAELAGRLRAILIPRVEFRETPLEDAVEFLRWKATEVEDEELKELNIVLKTTPGWSAGAVSLDDEKAFSFSSETKSPLINLKLANVPLGEALRYVAEAAGLEMRIEAHAVVLAPPPEDVISLIGSLDGAVQGLERGEDAAMPLTLYEALGSEYRVLEARGERLRAKGVAAGDPRREALAMKLSVTKEKIEAARALLVDYLKKQKALAEEWVEEVAE